MQTIEDTRRFSFKTLEKLLGKYGFDLYQKVRGVADSTLHESSKRKSIGYHETFSEDTADMNYVFKVLENMSVNIIAQIQNDNYTGFRTVVATVRFADFATRQCSLTSKELMVTERVLVSKAMKLTLPFFEKKHNPDNKLIRMIGLRVEKLE